MIDNVEYVVMDYAGEPVIIYEGEICEDDDPPTYWDASRDKRMPMEWNSRYCCYEEQEPEDEPCGNDRELYGTGWYDCNTDWRSW